MLIKGLPADSATALSYTEGKAWTNDTELMAVQAELIGELIRITAAAAGAKKRDVPDSLKIPRPFEPPTPQRRKATVTDLAVIFGGALDVEIEPPPEEVSTDG